MSALFWHRVVSSETMGLDDDGQEEKARRCTDVDLSSCLDSTEGVALPGLPGQWCDPLSLKIVTDIVVGTSLERNHYENKGMSVHNHVISDATRYTIQRILDKGHRGPRRHYFAQERTKCKTF
ncbi:hypothetical protein J6590_085433 [Homalodisca vitripennis]|nr:hypothetical protein J6590_085433 [Homalodisca vitripennis]